MEQFQSRTAAPGYGMSHRKIHDRLRALLRLVELPDPPVGQIRVRLKELPAEIIAEIEDRAGRRWPHLFGEAASEILCHRWLPDLPRDDLVAILQYSISYGGMIVPGRGRGSDRRSQPRFEPLIRGVVRGSAFGKSARGEEADAVANGRPRDDVALELISFLAMDYALATGQRPVPGRSDGSLRRACASGFRLARAA